MPPVRVVVTVQEASAEAADEAIRKRVEICERTRATDEGCLQYEVYRSVERPECFVLLELWASKALYDNHWRNQQERERANPAPPAPPGARRATVEMYKQTIFQRLDGIWQALDPEERTETIRWT